MMSDTSCTDAVVPHGHPPEGIRQCGPTRWHGGEDPAQGLTAIFRPRSVALIGATDRPGSVGRALLENLLAGPPGRTIHPINPRHALLRGHRCYPTVAAAPGPIDLAVIAVPAAAVPAAVEACTQARVGAAIVISAGFAEIGPAGAALAAEVQAIARRGGLRLIGPNCMGVIDPHTHLNASFVPGMPASGGIVVLSQSGAVGAALLDGSRRQGLGIRAFVSTGGMIDIGWAELLAQFGTDPQTTAILLYLETIGDARAFLSAARAITRRLPVVVLKPGRSPDGARAARAHTGADTGDDAAIDAAFAAAGVMRVSTMAEFFGVAAVAARQPRPAGHGLAILTNGGGPAVLAADTAIAAGLQVAPLLPSTLQALDQLLPAHWSHGDPVDVLGDADGQRYGTAARLVLADPGVHGLLALAAPQALGDLRGLAQGLADAASAAHKPVLACWLGGPAMDPGRQLLHERGIPCFADPETAVRVLALVQHREADLVRLDETPAETADGADDPGEAEVGPALARAQAAGLRELSAHASARLLGGYGLRGAQDILTSGIRDAVHAADAIGLPVEVELHLHPTDGDHPRSLRRVVRARAGVADAVAELQSIAASPNRPRGVLGVVVRPAIAADALRLRLATWTDPQLGPVVQLGWSGALGEVAPPAVVLPPLHPAAVARLLQQSRIAATHAGRQPAIRRHLTQALEAVARLVTSQRLVAGVVIDPLLVDADRCLAQGAHITLHAAGAAVPRPAIRPYPSEYAGTLALHGTTLRVRPLRPADEPALARFHAGLSPATVRLRYFHAMGLEARTAHLRLGERCHVDYERELPLIAEEPAADGTAAIVAVARLDRDRTDPTTAELAVVVSDAWQHRGLGTALVERLLAAAPREGYARLIAVLLPENAAMERLLTRAGFALRWDGEVGVVRAERALAVAAPAPPLAQP